MSSRVCALSDELRRVLNAVKHFPTDDELQEMIADVDSNTNGGLEFDEFAAMMARKENEDDNIKALLKKAFRLLDTDETGYLTPDELKTYMVNLGHADFREKDAAMMIADADRNQDGQIDYEEVRRTMCSGCF